MSLKLAAIDIGSNAIRLQVTNVIDYGGELCFKKLEYIRFPLRLGHDAFKYGQISADNEDRFFRLMNAFKILIDLYAVDDYYACATSAMRESKNGRLMVKRVSQLLGLTVHIIDGKEEARLINNVLQKDLDDEAYLHIDVGGGSTELNIIQQRENVRSESFKLGSVRTMEENSNTREMSRMIQWIQKHLNTYNKKLTAIGTGGNIQKLYELSNKTGKDRSADISDLEQTYKYLKTLSLDDKINKLRLNPDRADVIIPASNIYLSAMKNAGVSQILVPDIGLKDGVMQMLYQKHIPDSLLGL